MNKQSLRFTFFLLIFLTLSLTATAQVVDIPDSNLRAAIENALGKSAGVPITVDQMAALTRLEAQNVNISDLTGLEHATNLTELFLGDEYVEAEDRWMNSNSVTDLSPLAELTSLIRLELRNNNISNISAVAGLTNLILLDLNNNNISDISALEGLTNLTWLNLWYNNISDISALVDLTSLKELSLGGNTISDISSVAGLTNLTSLNLAGNLVSDIAPVASLTTLTYLDLDGNVLSDISAVAGLTNLIFLDIWGTPISDISPVAGLTNLTTLGLGQNNISDISPVAGLTNLTGLYLPSNHITDISSLSGLINLKTLWLNRNNILDLSPLAANTGLGSGDTVNVRQNRLNYQSLHTHIPTLQSRGVTIQFDNRTPATLLTISGVITELDNLLTVEVRDSNGLAFEGVPVTFTVTSGGGTLSTTRTMTNENGRAESRLTLGHDGNANIVSASVEGVSEPVDFSDVTVNIPDPNLRAVIETTLNKAPGAPIAPAEIAALTRLEARNANINDLTGLEGATNLTSLDLGPEKVANEWRNSNAVKDLSPLAGLTQLTSLHLPNNSISDISAVAGLTNLTWLNLWDNSVSNISAVAGLTNLKDLYLGNNNISDISPLVANTGLGEEDEVDVRGNRLSDQSLFTHIPILQSRGVTVEFDKRLPRPTIDTNGIVRVVYLLPSDRPARPDRMAALRQLIKDAQQFYADEMHRHGFGRKTFTIETDANGEPVVHQINGKFTDEYYYKKLTDFKVWAEFLEHFDGDDLQHIYFIAIDLSYEVLNEGEACGLGGPSFFPVQGDIGFGPPGKAKKRHRDITSGEEVLGGSAVIPASGDCFERLGLTTHELGHTFGIDHDFREGRNSDYVMAFGEQNRLSKCAAEWLSVSRFFNTKSIFRNEPGEIQLLSLGIYNQDTINFRFKVTDPDGLHQAQLLVPESFNGTGWGANRLFGCKRLNGKTGTVEFVVSTAEIVDRITLQIIDVGGNITWATFPIQLGDMMLEKISGDNQKGVSFAPLPNPFVVEVRDANGFAIAGVPVTLAIIAGGGTLNTTSTTTNENGRAQITLTLGPNLGTNTVEVSAAGIQGAVSFQATSDYLPTEYLLSIPAGISLIHVPLKVTTVDGVPKTITSVADLYDALGGADNVNLLITHDPTTQRWHSYLGNMNRGTVADSVLTNDKGIIAVMNNEVSLRLGGEALSTNGNSSITLHPGINLVGVPLRDSRIARVTDLLALEGVGGNVPFVIFSDNGAFQTVGQSGAVIVLDDGTFKTVGQVGDAGDIPITGGQSFILNAQEAATVAISGGPWYNTSEMVTVLPPAIIGIEVEDTTPILVLSGSIVDKETPVNKDEFHITVKNLSTGRTVTTIIGDGVALNPDLIGKVGYQLTIIDVETGGAAMIGDILEISVQSPDPLIGVEPLRYTVTAEDVQRSQIQLGELVAYEILWETSLLQNYPNPFTPETWIPYRLAEDASVTLTIYDLSGHLVRTLDVGHRIAAVYESESKAIYWNGRNDLGEQAASGVYFFTLTAGDFSATRKMLILK